MCEKMIKSLIGGATAVLASAVLSGSFSVQAAVENGWEQEDGKWYWYENGVRQGYDANNAAYRGKEIYDPASNAWYWLDNVQKGAMAVSKDVYQDSAADDAGNVGKWVRYDAEGHMVKGWDVNGQGTYYFNLTYGTMLKGKQTIDGVDYYFNETSGALESCSAGFDNGWVIIDDVEYWYENGIRQGYNPMDASYRGKEIYDPASDAWYWLDNVDQGKKATDKDVYQESYAGEYADRPDGTGKWVRYDEAGHMVKGWNVKDGNTYYFDSVTGAMVKGSVTIGGKAYSFDSVTGILEGNRETACNLSSDSFYYKYEYAYRNQDTSGLAEDDMAFYRGLKEYLDYAYGFTTPYEQEKAVHDYMADNCEYDRENYMNNTVPIVSHSAEGVFVYKTAVCDGYASAFQLCMDILGIECRTVVGPAKGAKGWEGHAWNAVQLEGEWYMVDVTWDSGRDGDNKYGYFNLPFRAFRKDHKTDSAWAVETYGEKYQGDYVLTATTAEAFENLEALIEEHYREDTSDTLYRLVVTKEDGTDWTEEELENYAYLDMGSVNWPKYQAVMKKRMTYHADGATAWFSYARNDVILREYHITTNTQVSQVEAYTSELNESMGENERLLLCLDKAVGNWSTPDESLIEVYRLLGVNQLRYNMAWRQSPEGNSAMVACTKINNQVWEYVVEDAGYPREVDYEPLIQFLKECAEKNPGRSDAAVIRIRPREGVRWNKYSLDDMYQYMKDNVPEPFYTSTEIVYEDGSVAQVYRSMGSN